MTSFILAVHDTCKRLAWNNGYRIVRGEEAGWIRLASHDVSDEIALTGEGVAGPFFLALDHPGVIAEFGAPAVSMNGPGLARYAFPDGATLYDALSDVYDLATSLPDAPLDRFRAAVAAMPRTTETERMAVQRLGQGLFREALMSYWHGRCPLTGIEDASLLRASHIIPWAECDDAERMDVHNGLLLSALWDAAFDRHLVSFDPDGTPLFAPGLGEAARAALVWHSPLTLTDAHCSRLVRHAALTKAMDVLD